jgi:ABC-2 type transport system ATP-binding protein
LRNCSLDISPGTVTALVGPNGAGKSTLLHLAVGLLRPSEGSVRVFGSEPASTATALGRVGYLAQQHPLYGRLSVRDHLRMGRGMNPGWDDGFARSHLDSVGIGLDQRAGTLSGGQQAQVALTLALATRPGLLVLDEPVASLDPLARRDFMTTVLTDVADRGTTVVLSSHVISELERVCDHLVALTAGTVQVSGEIDDLLDRHRLLHCATPDVPRPRVRQVLAETVTDREVTLVVELDEPVLDPRWTVSSLTLEDLALAYLRDPGAGTRRSTLGVVGGQR